MAARTDWWKPQPGPQTLAFLTPLHWEIFYGGARGGGKTDTAIALAGQHCLLYGEAAVCLVIRAEKIQLRDFRQRAKQVYRPLGVRYVGGMDECFIFPNGGRIYLGHCRTVEDAEKWQGWGVNLLIIEELTNWPNPEPVRRLFGCVRSARTVGGRPVPARWFATGNPGGRGHSWVKEEWIEGSEPFVPRPVVDERGRQMLGADGKPAERVFIPAKLEDNPALLKVDPGYVGRLERQAGHLAHAWRWGDWDVAPGAFFEKVWDPAVHVIDNFDPPYYWPRSVSIDWGSAKPYSVGWWCIRPDDGAAIRYRELYGYGGRANVGTRETVKEVAARMTQIEEEHEPPGAVWRPDVADPSMWAEHGHERGLSLASEMRDAGRERLQRGPKGTIGRVATLGLVASALQDRKLFVMKRCRHWLRTVPVIAPDPDNPEDVDTEAEDHCIDETRYFFWTWHRRQAAVRPEEEKRRARPRPAVVSGEVDPLTGRRQQTAEDVLAMVEGR